MALGGEGDHVVLEVSKRTSCVVMVGVVPERVVSLRLVFFNRLDIHTEDFTAQEGLLGRDLGRCVTRLGSILAIMVLLVGLFLF